MSDNATTNQQQQQMSTVPDEVIVDAIKNHANIFHNINATETYDGILNNISDSTRFVFLGESTHGTEEYYQFRSNITKLLMEKKGFNVLCIEGDWPNADNIRKYIRTADHSNFQNANDLLLNSFQSFPKWMWQNEVFRDLVEWMKQRNKAIKEEQKNGAFIDEINVYGLDLYSMSESQQKLEEFLDIVDPNLAKKARERYSCLKEFDGQHQKYGRAANGKLKHLVDDIQKNLMKTLTDVQFGNREKETQYCLLGPDEQLSAEQNAEIVVNGEEYYRKSHSDDGGGVVTWNTRDQHMVQTMMRIDNFLAQNMISGFPKMIIWAHNSHVGDVRASSIGKYEWNLGHMMRATYGVSQTHILTFSTNEGTVRAARNWGEEDIIMELNRPIKSSIADLLNNAYLVKKGKDNGNNDDGGLIINWRTESLKLKHTDGNNSENSSSTTLDSSSNLTTEEKVFKSMLGQRKQRFIGVSYHKDNEVKSHYLDCSLPMQCDCHVFIKKTNGLVKLGSGSGGGGGGGSSSRRK